MNTEYLSDLEKSAVISFRDNEAMREAVRKVLLRNIFGAGTLRAGVAVDTLRNPALNLAFKTMRSGELTNEQLGEDIRGLAQAMNYLEVAYNEMMEIQLDKETKEVAENPAV